MTARWIVLAGSFIALAAGCSSGSSPVSEAAPADPPAGAELTTDCPDHGLRTDRSLAIDPSDDAVVYVGVEGRGFFKTIDGGTTWTRVVAGLKSPRITGSTRICYEEFFVTTIDARDPRHLCLALNGDPGTLSDPRSAFGGVYCSNDAATTWVQRVSPTMNTAVTAVAIDPTDSTVLFAGVNGSHAMSGAWLQTTGSIYRSRDGGATWSELDTGYVHGQGIAEIVIDPHEPARVYAAAMGVDKSAQPEDRFFASQWGVLASKDGGASWTSRTAGMATATNGQRAITFMALSPGNPERLFATSGADQPNAPYGYVSTDGAGTFHAPTVTPSVFVSVFAFDPGDPGGLHMLGFAANDPHLWESTDGGEAWVAVAELPPDATDRPVRLSCLRWSAVHKGTLYASGTLGSVYRSVDVGRTWAKILSADALP